MHFTMSKESDAKSKDFHNIIFTGHPGKCKPQILLSNKGTVTLRRLVSLYFPFLKLQPNLTICTHVIYGISRLLMNNKHILCLIKHIP